MQVENSIFLFWKLCLKKYWCTKPFTYQFWCRFGQQGIKNFKFTLHTHTNVYFLIFYIFLDTKPEQKWYENILYNSAFCNERLGKLQKNREGGIKYKLLINEPFKQLKNVQQRIVKLKAIKLQYYKCNGNNMYRI